MEAQAWEMDSLESLVTPYVASVAREAAMSGEPKRALELLQGGAI